MIDEQDIQYVAERLGQAAGAEQVILFGSYARGDATEDSDVDLLIIADSPLPRFKRSRSLYALLRPYPFGLDLLVYTPTLIGREAELAQLHDWFAQAQAASHQLIFVAGEPGIGKTTLVDAFVEQLSQDSQCWIGRGQCIESYGNGAGYLPVLDVLGQWAKGSQQAELRSVLREVAPTWLIQLPRLVEEAEFERLQQYAALTTQTRMLRELAEALEQVATERTVVIVLEDLHWSDASTLEWLAMMARRREQPEQGEMTRLCILGTYRPAEVRADGHPLGKLLPELRAHSQCQELTLTGLNEAAIKAYVDQRFPNSTFPTRLSAVLEQRTGGNPLFLVNVLDELISQEVLVQEVLGQEVLGENAGAWRLHVPLADLPHGVPTNLRQLLQQPMQRLSQPVRRVLEAGSLAGAEFSAATVAAALAVEVDKVEDQTEALVEQEQFLRRAGLQVWPDGTQAACYGFRHAFYQQLWHEQVPTTRRRRWHCRMGERLEAAYGQQVNDIAPALALHFHEGQDYPRAVHYCSLAGQLALEHQAHHEAILQLQSGLTALKQLPASAERTAQELELQMTVVRPLMTVHGAGAAEVEAACLRADALSRQDAESVSRFRILRALGSIVSSRAEHVRAHDIFQQSLHLAQRLEQPGLVQTALIDLADGCVSRAIVVGVGFNQAGTAGDTIQFFSGVFKRWRREAGGHSRSRDFNRWKLSHLFGQSEGGEAHAKRERQYECIDVRCYMLEYAALQYIGPNLSLGVVRGVTEERVLRYVECPTAWPCCGMNVAVNGGCAALIHLQFLFSR